MVVDVLKQMRERLEIDSAHQQAQKSDKKKVYAYTTPIPDDLWIKCPNCNGIMFREDFEKAGQVCTICGNHYRIDSRQRIAQICDAGTFSEFDAGLASLNPIDFAGYPEKLAQLQKQTGLKDAVVTGRGQINGQDCLLAVMDGRFMMGSMGSVVGEKITRVFEKGIELHLPVITFSVSGGARMQEGIISLMQMAKTSAAVGRLQAAGLLYISVMTDPTTGGVTASFASLGDIIISEPGTLIGFAGRRVIEGTIAEALPEGFQRAEFLLEHGFLDLIVPRSRMKQTLGNLLALHSAKAAAPVAAAPAATPADPAAVAPADAASAAAASDDAPDIAINTRTGSERLDIIRQRNRPVISDYLPLIFDQAIELHGDRGFKDDLALWGGIGSLNGQAVTIVGHRKGRTIEENTRANFGMPHPEGYRKALRLMKEAERFNRPVICLVDTSGAYCGVGAEERGQGEAIARNLLEMAQLKVPIIVVVMGEGGSGGALAIGVGDELAMLSNALYSVISPRGFASLLWKDPTREREAADKIKITAEDLSRLGVCDQIIAEPPEGAHTNLSQTAANMRQYLVEALARQTGQTAQALLDKRYAKFRKLGFYTET